MNLKEKKVWDLSLDEIEFIYRHRHMNHYVYAALKTYYTSSPPVNKPVSLRQNMVPPYLCPIIEKLLEFSPLVGKDDASYVRAGITFYTHKFQAALDQVQLEDVPIILQLLAVYAYFSIASTKNEKILLWKESVVRQKNESITKIMEKLLQPTFNIEKASMQFLSGWKDRMDDAWNLYNLIPKVMCSIIVCMENGDDPQLIKQALLNIEQAMYIYELNHGLINPRSPVRVRDFKQTKYRNTLYLYGGMFFEKQGWHNSAVDWYLKDINHPTIPSYLCWRHLMAFKTIERLMSAYPLITDTQSKEDLGGLIHRSFVEAFRLAACYSQEILEYLEPYSSLEIRNLWLSLRGEKRHFLNAGEHIREVFYLSLLYNKFVLGTDYRDIEYARFFKY